jgi:hypothetical protein
MSLCEEKLYTKVASLQSKIKELQIDNEYKYHMFVQETQSSYDDIHVYEKHYIRLQNLYMKSEYAVQKMSSGFLDECEQVRIASLKQCCRILSVIVLKIIDYSIIFFETINSLKPRCITPCQQNDGAEWLHFMCQVYLNNSGKYNVSTTEFFNHFKKIWPDLSDQETIEISHITDVMFGGTSISNIAHNFERWIRSNQDCLRPSEISIFMSYFS